MMANNKKMKSLKEEAKKLGWRIEIEGNNSKFIIKTSKGTQIGFEFDFSDEKNFVRLADVYALDYWSKSSHAKDIRSIVENFKNNYTGENFYTVDELCDYLEEYNMTLRKDDQNANYFFLAVNNGCQDYLHRFKVTDGLYSHTIRTDKVIQNIINFVLKFNAEYFAYMYLFKTKEQKQMLKKIYKESDEISELYHKLFNIADEIRFGQEE